jgi:hypothetical protein
MTAARRVLVGTVLGGVLGFYFAEKLAVGYRVRLPRRARALPRPLVSSSLP